MNYSFRDTGLWLRSLGQHSPNDRSDQLPLLLVNYQSFRDRAAILTARIAHSLPNLTVHDITHLDALWETADLIAGESYPLNPMEGFVLGGAILLHDAALCFEAFEKGLEGLRETLEWRDAFATEKDRAEESIPLSSIEANADFTALRALHARQASQLAMRKWSGQDGSEFYLIDNAELRSRYGNIIGLIAASHHWPIEDVVSKLSGQVNAPGTFPLEWRIDPVKIACLLRCADAAHIDNRRAPDFLMALTRRYGISLNHWKAQNWLARIDKDASDPTGSSAVFTSNRDFNSESVEAWWVAFDAITLVDREIQSVNQLLASRPQKEISPAFRIRRIAGATSPESLGEYIRASGWKPCSAKLHVGNVERLVEGLGGTKLYGESNQLEIALRELIQNARDAVQARQAMESEYAGRIRVQLKIEPYGINTIVVEDDGIGMSERVLTGPFLDFGTSFWLSDLVQEEFPGLRSSGFRSVGRFGIGFYATFMVAKAVRVSTRRWDAGLNDVRTLDFPNGLTLRPTLSSTRPASFGSISTRVQVSLKDAFTDINTIRIKRHRIDGQDFSVTFNDFVAALVAGLDVTVECRAGEQNHFEIIHDPIDHLTSPIAQRNWLEKISFSTYQADSTVKNLIDQSAHRLRFIENDSGEKVGLAALSNFRSEAPNFLSVNCIGGLATSVHGRDSTRFIGYLDHHPQTAKRDAGKRLASNTAMKKWADEQIALLQEASITDMEWCYVTNSLCDLDVDPLAIARVVISSDNQLHVLTISQLVSLASKHGIAMYKSPFMDHIETYHKHTSFRDYPTIIPVRNSAFLSLKRTDGIPESGISLIGCMHRESEQVGRKLRFELISDAGFGILGKLEALVLTIE
ncbi:ATP-binding protein [Mesorhizobium sp. IMUNJ 23232]|uniref:HD domain-containing protein n=1 Tax=Mesorhizobium sp. IMUNJ 23232 TaxID=3376064 RepID=UPI003790EF3F